MTALRNKFAIVTLVIPVTDDWPRPDKTDWTRLVDHAAPIQVRDCEYGDLLDLTSAEIEELREVYEPADIFAAADGEPVKADSWFWQIGDRWVAVAGESEADWFADTKADGIDMPNPRTYPIDEVPPSGLLVYRHEGGDDVEVPAELFFTKASVGV